MPNKPNVDERQGLAEVIAQGRRMLAEKLPQFARTAAKGLVPLSLALGLLPVLQAPETIFLYLAGLAPNLISDMLMDMRTGKRQPDVNALATAIAGQLTDTQRLADELQIVPSLIGTLKTHSDQLKELTQTLSQELASSHWPVSPETQTILADMVAQGQYIVQVQKNSTGILVVPGATLNYAPPPPDVPRKSFLRILVGGTGDLLAEREAVRQAVLQIHEPTYPELEVVSSQAVTPREAHQMLMNCDVYIGLLGARYGQMVIDGKSITHFEIETAYELSKPVRLYRKLLPDEELDDAQSKLIAWLASENRFLASFNPLDEIEDLSVQIQQHLREWLSGESAPKPRVRPNSGRRGLIAPLGRAPGAVTGLYHALKQSGVPIDYVRTISTSERQVTRAVKVVKEELTRQGMTDYQDAAIGAEEFAREQDVIEFKAAVSQQLAEARLRGDAVAISITGGRTVMGALLTLVSQMEAPAESVLYQFSVPDSIEEDGRMPSFDNQREERKQQILRPKEFFPNQCHLIAVPFSRLYAESEAT